MFLLNYAKIGALVFSRKCPRMFLTEHVIFHYAGRQTDGVIKPLVTKVLGRHAWKPGKTVMFSLTCTLRSILKLKIAPAC